MGSTQFLGPRARSALSLLLGGLLLLRLARR
jgi:hypothetical protein